ncbi:MAG: tetratricopeptide repeat protein [Spirochaetes bacterium]|nr:tetratricopeptide repeat protein [Spirochaetota bacterium]
MSNITKTNFLFLCAVLIFHTGKIGLFSQNVQELDRLAEEYYDKRDFSRAIETWMLILDQDPYNEKIQKKIERVYDEKYKRDVAFQKAKIFSRKAKKQLLINLNEKNLDEAIKNFQEGKRKAQEALAEFVTAYRIDPLDPELQVMKEEMRELDRDIKAAEAKIELDRKKREKYLALLECGREKMKQELFKESLECWDALLEIIPDDREGIEGKRKAELALTNRLRFEKVQNLLAQGKILFDEKKYFDARQIYKEVLGLDPRNDEAKEKIYEIDQKLEEARFAEQKRLQAEGFYTAGINYLNENKFDEAEEEFRNVLDLVKDYKDTKKRLAEIPILRKEYLNKLQREKIQKIERGIDAGMLAYAEGRYDAAIASFEEVLQLDPKNELAKKQLALAKDAKSIEEEEKVDENSPYFDLVNVLIVSGKQLYDQGNYSESRKKWEKILQLFPKNKTATTYMLKCLKENPVEFERFSKNIVEEGKELLKTKDFIRAKSKFEIVKSIYPNYPGIDNLLKNATVGEIAKPVQLERGVTQAELNAKYNLGLAYYKKGGEVNIKKALEEFRWVYARDPNNINALVNINKIESILRVSRGEGEAKGQVVLTEEQKKLVRQYYYKGISYYANNEFDKAIQEWRKVLAIDRNHENARNNIKKCLVLLRK